MTTEADWREAAKTQGHLEPQKLEEEVRTVPGAFRGSTALPTPWFGTSGL